MVGVYFMAVLLTGGAAAMVTGTGPSPQSSMPSYPINMHVMAHRGCCAGGKGGHAPENTMEAFAYAQSVGALMFETDLRFTKDGHVVLMHDSSLDRTTNCTGDVSAWMLADIRRLCDAGAWLNPRFAGTKVPTLPEMLTFVASSGMNVVLDLKVMDLSSSIIEVAKATDGLELSQLVPSINFHQDAADVVAHFTRSTILLNPTINSAIPSKADAGGARYFGDLREMGVDAIFINYDIKVPSIAEIGEASLRYGVQTWGWTLDTPQAWAMAKVAGVRVVCTNDPAGALERFRNDRTCMSLYCHL